MASKVAIKWLNKNNQAGKLFIFKSKEKFTQAELPDPLVVIQDPTITSYEDTGVMEGNTYYYMLAFGETIKRSFSELFTLKVAYSSSEPYNLQVNADVNNNKLNMSWLFPRQIGAGFIYYNSPESIDPFNLPKPKKIGIKALEYVDKTVNLRRKNYVWIGIEKGGVKYFSNQVEIKSEYPYNLELKLIDGKLGANWQYDYTAEYFNYYHSDKPIDLSSLPVPKATKLTEQTYSDSVFGASTENYVRIGVVQNGIEKISDELKFIGAPYQVQIQNINRQMVISWKTDQKVFSSFNYYCEDLPIDPENLPAPKASGITETNYTDTQASIYGVKYVLIGIIVDGVEYLSQACEYRYTSPYEVTVSLVAAQLITRWSYDHNSHNGFNYYCEDSPIDPDNLPEPKASGIMQQSYTDISTSQYGRKYICIGVIENDVEYLSEVFIYKHPNPHTLNMAIVYGQLMATWLYDQDDFDFFNFYCEDVPIIRSNLPEPKATNLTELNYTYASAPHQGKKYIRIGAVKSGVEYLSSEFIYGYPWPYKLSVSAVNEQVESSWLYDRIPAAGFNYYCEEIPIDPENLPAPKVSGITQSHYIDSAVSPYGKKYIMVGVPRAGRVYLSNEFIYLYPRPYHINAQLTVNGLSINWLHDFDSETLFNYYCETSSIDLDNLPEPKASGLSGLSYMDETFDTAVQHFVRIGMVRNGKAYLSDEIITEVVQVPEEPTLENEGTTF